MDLPEPLQPDVLINPLFEANTCRPLLSVLTLALPNGFPFAPGHRLFSMTPGQHVGFFAQGLDLLGQQSRLLGRGVSLFPKSVTDVERCAELVQSRSIVVRRTGERILSVKGAGGAIFCLEFRGLTGDQPVNFAFFLGDEVKLPAFGRVRDGRPFCCRNFLLKRRVELLPFARVVPIHFSPGAGISLHH